MFFVFVVFWRVRGYVYICVYISARVCVQEECMHLGTCENEQNVYQKYVYVFLCV